MGTFRELLESELGDPEYAEKMKRIAKQLRRIMKWDELEGYGKAYEADHIHQSTPVKKFVKELMDGVKEKFSKDVLRALGDDGLKILENKLNNSNRNTLLGFNTAIIHFGHFKYSGQLEQMVLQTVMKEKTNMNMLDENKE